MICLYCKKAETCKRNKANVKSTCSLFEEDPEKRKELQRQVEEKRKELEQKCKNNPYIRTMLNLYDMYGLPKNYK